VSLGTDPGPVGGLIAGLVRHQPAGGLLLLGLGSALRGLTLEGPVPIGGTWGWKSAEALAFVLGESTAVRWAAFGGAFSLSWLLAWGLARRRGPVRWLATVPLAADLALAWTTGDPANAAVHVAALGLVWVSPRGPGGAPGLPSARRPPGTPP
jgi:hypothetical protein